MRSLVIATVCLMLLTSVLILADASFDFITIEFISNIGDNIATTLEVLS